MIATTVFVVFTLFLDEYDVFTILSKKKKLRELELVKQETSDKLEETRLTLQQLNSQKELEKFARENKFFKKDNEDIFVIFEE